MDEFEKRLSFIIEIDKLKNVFRQSIVTKSLRNENDAEHSWHLCMMAILFEEYAPYKTDILKCIKMLLIHDLVEIYAGDTYLYDEEKNSTKAEREEEAAKKIYGMLDEKQGKYLYELWHEFDEANTKEAVFANTLDRLQPLLLNYLTGGAAWKKHNISQKQVIEKGAFVFENADENLKNLRNEIIKKSVEKGYLLP